MALLTDDAADLLGRLAAIRRAGDVPLVIDHRWSAGQQDTARRAAAELELPSGAAWATLTSGSSGTPRVVLRTDPSWSNSFAAVASLLGADASDRLWLPAPASSSLSLFSLAHALRGGPVPSEPSTATLLHGTPQSLRAALESGAAPGLRAALVGGSHLDPDLRRQADGAGIRIVAYYGAAELSFVAVDTGDGLRAFPGVDIDVRQGELWVRSPYVALGYAGSDGPLRSDGEWATVGDRAESFDGRLRLLGRADDAILSASATIVPEEVEAVLRRVRGVREAVVFGWPVPRIGALVAAHIELDAGADHEETAAALRTMSAERLHPTHRPRRWVFGPVPRGASGKPLRSEVARTAIRTVGREGDVEAHVD
jgi:acyl-CoA synthetase (AMP-forming)/AMP-acid ligase II